MRQVLLQTAEMSFFNFSISLSFSFLEFSNCDETGVPVDSYERLQNILSHKLAFRTKTMEKHGNIGFCSETLVRFSTST